MSSDSTPKRKGEGSESRTKRARLNPFVDDIAEVEHAEDEEEEGEGEQDGFIVADDIDEGNGTVGAPFRQGPPPARLLGSSEGGSWRWEVNTEENVENDLDELAWETQYDLGSLPQTPASHWTAFEDTQATLAAHSKLGTNDHLWEVGCKHGEEDKVVYRIMRRAQNPTMPMRRAKNIFSNPNIGGRVFIEACTEEDVCATIEGVSGIYSRRVQSVPQALYSRLLRVYGKPAPEKDDWIILRKSKDIPKAYDGAYGWIFDRDDSTESEGLFHVIAVPRWEQHSLQTTRVGGSNPETGEYVPPFQVVDVVREVIPTTYTAAEMEEAEEKGRVMVKIALETGDWKIIKHEGEYLTSDGFVCFWAVSRSSFIHNADIIPDRATIERFRQATFLSDSGPQQLLDVLQQRLIKCGDRIYIHEGTYRSKVGVVQSLVHPMAFVDIESLDATVELPLQSLRLNFCVFDQVEVVSGPHTDQWGWITGINGDRVELYIQDLSTVVEDKQGNLAFHEVNVSLCNLHKLDLERYVRARDIREDSQAMRQDANKIYLRKRVMITGKGHWKGHKGIIIAVDYQGVASVEMRTMSSYVVKVPLDRLRLLKRDDTMGDELSLFNMPKSRVDKRKRTPQATQVDQGRGSATPLPTTPLPEGTSPAWTVDAADIPSTFFPPPFPLDTLMDPIDFLWLRDEMCRNFRIPVRQVFSKTAARYTTHTHDVQEVSEDGKRLRIRIIRNDIWLDCEEVRPLAPQVPVGNGPRPLVTPWRTTNPYFGQCFVLSKAVDGRMKLRHRGQKNVTKKNPELDCAIDGWLIVSSLKKV